LPLKSKTYRTLTDVDLLEAELDRLAMRGIGVDNEEFVRGMVAVAVPVRHVEDGRVLAALAVHSPTARSSLEDLLKAVPKLKEIALRIGPLLQPATTTTATVAVSK
jgi:DNA-binding IclR family transcriptional regulator